MDTYQRADAAAHRIAALKQTFIVKERACSACRFGPINEDGEGRCEHFAHWDIAHDPLSGRASLRIPVTTAQARAPSGLCGPDGILFQGRTWIQRIAARLARMEPDMLATAIFFGILLSVMAVAAIRITILGAW